MFFRCIILGEITNFTGLDRSLIGKYLNVLIDLGIIKREIPVTASIKSKKGIYLFRDNAFTFWFRFIFPFEDLIELGRGDIVLQNIKKDLNVYLGRTFEDISKQFLWEINPGSKLPFPFLKLGSWWYKENEIDIIALDNESNILLLEVKWKELSISNAFGILEKLKIKSRHVKWHNENRIEHYGIIAKKIRSKKRLIDAGYYAFDLEDFNSACKQEELKR